MKEKLPLLSLPTREHGHPDFHPCSGAASMVKYTHMRQHRSTIARFLSYMDLRDTCRNQKKRGKENIHMGRIQIFTGDGYGKTSAALGEALLAASKGQRVVIIQFLKGRGLDDNGFERKLEPEIKIFRFEKSDSDYFSLPKEKQQEEVRNIRNGLNFAKKVLTTGECDLLILDEVLELVRKDIIEEEELENVLEARGEDTAVTLTGRHLGNRLKTVADRISRIEKFK